MDNKELIIQPKMIESGAARLKQIANSVQSKSIRDGLLSSKGNTADSINSLINQLNAVGQDLSKIMAENAKYVHNIAKEFKQMDNDLASDISD
ncbi:MAG: hypothetical protein E7517_00080 [Ruminococcaceae bacterium]|nr:hypothetical protein [Oscillospiraceae bacterium]